MWWMLVACGLGPPPEGDSDSGGGDGAPARCTAPARPAEGCGDLDCDGVADLVFAQTEDAAGDYVTTSTVAYGPDFARTAALPTLGAADVAVADLDGDDRPDLVFANLSDGERRDVDSYVYWNGADGFQEERRTALPTVGASDVEVADVDGDGFRDLVFANRYDGSGMSEDAYRVDVWVYLGAADGFDAGRRLAVPGFGAAQTAVADVDHDGWNDLVVANGTFFTDESWIYFGSADGFAEADRVAVPTWAPEGVVAADLDDDGWSDLVFANFYDDAVLDIDSSVYWGGAHGFGADAPAPTAIPTHGADDVVARDLDGDDCAELVFANAMDGTFFDMDFVSASAVWSVDRATHAVTERATMETVSAAALAVGDLDADGALDLAFANRYDPVGEAGPAVSYVYAGPAYTSRREIPMAGAAGVAVAEPASP